MIIDVRSTFKFKRQPKLCLKQFTVDEDGDLVVRRSPLSKGITIGTYIKPTYKILYVFTFNMESIEIFFLNILLEHINRTSLNMVGMQVWRSALLLGDFIIENRDIFTSDKVVMELGAGVGLTGIIAAMYCKEIIFTGEHIIIIYYLLISINNCRLLFLSTYHLKTNRNFK